MFLEKNRDRIEKDFEDFLQLVLGFARFQKVFHPG